MANQKVSLPHHIKMKIEWEYGVIFNLPKDQLLNRMIDALHNECDGGFNGPFGENITFNIHDHQLLVLEAMVIETGENNLSKHIRNILKSYFSNPQYKREQFIFKKEYNEILSAIKNRQKIILRSGLNVVVLNPYGILPDRDESYNHILAYDETNGFFVTHRLSVIHDSFQVSDIKYSPMKEEQYSQYINHFDPFLSVNQRVVVRWHGDYEKAYLLAVANRPRVLKCDATYDYDGEITVFESSSALAELYFAQFYEHVEIIEPKELRAIFKEKYQSTLFNYMD